MVETRHIKENELQEQFEKQEEDLSNIIQDSKLAFNKLRTIYPEIYQKNIEKENVHKKKQPSTARLAKS